MLMHDRPPTVDFLKANGQAEIELNFIPVRLRSSTAHEGRRFQLRSRAIIRIRL